MAKRSDKKKTSDQPKLLARAWESLGEAGRGKAMRLLLQMTAGICVVIGVVYVLGVLESFVEARTPVDPPLRLTLRGVPGAYRGRTAREILGEAEAAAAAGWSDDMLVERIGRRIADVGWIKEVKRIEKLYDGRVLIDCEYRIPMALVERAGEYYLVDREGVRLPGQYVNDPRYRLIAGVDAWAPEPGQPWEGEDLQAGLALLELLRNEPYWEQISAVSVHNFRGRADSRGPQIELVTIPAGPGRVAGRIRWGSALGEEIEEPTPEEKLATLRTNHTRYQRIDCNQMWIDVSAQRGGYLYPDSTSAMVPN